jgi:hypothetical protein
MLGLHQTLLEHLQKAVEASSYSGIAQAFSSHSQYLKVAHALFCDSALRLRLNYQVAIPYATNYPAASSLLTELRASRPTLADFLRVSPAVQLDLQRARMVTSSVATYTVIQSGLRTSTRWPG